MKWKPTPLVNSLSERTHIILQNGKLLAVISLPDEQDGWKEQVIVALRDQIEDDRRRMEDEKATRRFSVGKKSTP